MGTWTVVVAFAGVGRSRLRVRVCVSEHVSVCVWVGAVSGVVWYSRGPVAHSREVPKEQREVCV